MNKLIALCLLFTLSSCASRLIVTPKKCPNKAIWTNHKDNDLLSENKYWVIGKEKKVFLRDILKEKGITCSQLKSISLTVKKEWSDSLLSIFPFVGRRTLIIKGTKFKDIMDDSTAKDRP